MTGPPPHDFKVLKVVGCIFELKARKGLPEPGSGLHRPKIEPHGVEAVDALTVNGKFTAADVLHQPSLRL
jgi:hypothetical protein